MSLVSVFLEPLPQGGCTVLSLPSGGQKHWLPFLPAPDPPPRPWALVLTWSLDCDLELPTASTLGEHLEVSHFFDTHTLGLQAPPRGPAGVGVTGWEEEER